jgi:TPR repeat protein
VLLLSLLSGAQVAAAAAPPTSSAEDRVQVLLAEQAHNRDLIAKQQAELDTLRPLAQERLSAEQLNADGLKYYQKGDYESAVEHFRKAMAFDLPAAMTNLALCYLNAQGVAPDIRQAESLLERASGLGNVGASEALGKMYELALGVHFDRYRAIKWYDIALRQGSAIAGERLAQLNQGGDRAVKRGLSMNSP